MTDRRTFLKDSTSCAAWVLGLSAISPLATRRAFAQSAERKIVAKEPWGRLEQIADSVWGLISTPFESRDFTTVSNGGIIAGKERVLIIEALNQPTGAKWLAERAKELTGRWPTDVIVTHFHSDHSAGSGGFVSDDTDTGLWLTAETRELIEQQNKRRRAPLPMLKTIKSIDSKKPTPMDLGGRTVVVSSHIGHTASDVIVELKDPNVVFCGDLFFNKLIPNYSDAKPATLKTTVANLKREQETLYIPGHGAVASPQDLIVYQEFLAMMEDSVRTSHAKGDDVNAAAAAFKLPEEFAKWYIFSPQVVPRAFAAWYREFDVDRNDGEPTEANKLEQ